AHLRQPGPVWILAADECGPTCGAALLAVVVGESHALRGDAIDVGRAVAHQSFAVAADIRDPDIIAPDNQNVRLVGRHLPHPLKNATGATIPALAARPALRIRQIVPPQRSCHGTWWHVHGHSHARRPGAMISWPAHEYSYPVTEDQPAGSPPA